MKLPENHKIKNHILKSFFCYWGSGKLIRKLPIKRLDNTIKITYPLKLKKIFLPNWAVEIGVDGYICVPEEAILNYGKKNNEKWKDVDWFLAAFLMLECWHERLFEKDNGPIHSYSYKLKNWDTRAWERAWVNRMALFLMRYSLLKSNINKPYYNELKTNIIMTHDVDALEKTNSIRIKQSAFNIYNSFKFLIKKDFYVSKIYFIKAIKFFFSNTDWNSFDYLLKLENKNKVKAIYNFYFDARKKNFKRWLLDPGYNLKILNNKIILKKVILNNHDVGLHQSFERWKNFQGIKDELTGLKNISNIDIIKCRQHWLRFSWNETWKDQEKAGLKSDFTLMFNDRSGFRNSSAIKWNPWNHLTQRAHGIYATNTLMMDSHLYDYNNYSFLEQKKQIKYWLKECKFVKAEIAFLWHPHTLNKDYNWKKTFEYILPKLKN